MLLWIVKAENGIENKSTILSTGFFLNFGYLVSTSASVFDENLMFQQN